jgi:CheY-like chemotaxis protein
MNVNGKKILFVEDEPDAQTAYRNRLQREGFETLFAEDGDGALHTLSEGCPDLVVLDLMMPRANGPEVLKHIRSQDRLKGMPVLILSNDYVAGQSQRAMESGATRGMLKAECTPARLLETVRDMLGFTSAFDLTDKPISDESQSKAFIAAAEEAFADEMHLKETREEFIHRAPGEIAKIREHCLAYVKAGVSPAGLEHLNHLFQDVRFFPPAPACLAALGLPCWQARSKRYFLT